MVMLLLSFFFLCCADDGSSLSCCWANGGTAERLLRLHESTHKPHFHSCGSSMKAGIKSSLDTVGYHLEKMLKKHHRVVVKNNRAAPDSFTLGFTYVAESEEVFSCSDERLLRVIMLNACVGSIFVSTNSFPPSSNSPPLTII